PRRRWRARRFASTFPILLRRERAHSAFCFHSRSPRTLKKTGLADSRTVFGVTQCCLVVLFSVATPIELRDRSSFRLPCSAAFRKEPWSAVPAQNPGIVSS